MDKRKLHGEERGLRLLEVVMALMAVGFYVLCLMSADDARADDLKKINLKPEEHNGDFINRYAEMVDASASMNSKIFDESMSKEMREKYQGFDRVYEAKREYRLNGPVDEMNYQKSNQDFVEWTVKRLLQYHFEHTVKEQVEASAKKAANESGTPEGRVAAKAMSTVSSVQKALNNGTLNLGQETSTKFKYDFPSGVMRVGMLSPLVDTTMDYRIKAADPTVGAVQQPERLSLGLKRSFKELDASANGHYALMNGTLNYGMVKHVAGPVSAQVDQVHNVRDTSKDETVYRVNLGFNF